MTNNPAPWLVTWRHEPTESFQNHDFKKRLSGYSRDNRPVSNFCR
jgi:hypothetical protein